MALSASKFEQDVQLQSLEHDKFQSLLNILKGCEEFVLNIDGIIISSNLEAVTITGYEEWEVIGKHISFFYNEEDKNNDLAQKDLEKTAQIGKHVSSGFRVKKRGARFWAKMKFFSINDQDGGLTGYRVVLYDATHRAVSTVKNRRIKEEYLSIFNNSFIGVFKCSISNFSFTNLNDKAKLIIGSDKHVFLRDIFHLEAEYNSLLALLAKDNHAENYEFRLNCEEERFATISCKIFVVGGFIEGIINDTTEKRRQLLESERINRQLNNLNSELDNFLYHASHDIRAPLATILGLLNLTKSEASLERIHEYTNKMTERVTHLDALLRDLSAVAFNNSQPLQVEAINVPKIIRDIIKLFEKEYPFVQAHFAHEGEGILHTDVIRFSTIMNNIISNAFKYYNPHNSDPQVKIEFVLKEDHVDITVSDNGRGIHPTYINDVFKVFFRMDSRGTGSGLGLYVVQIMMNKLNGDIQLTSKLGSGTTIKLKIPNMK